jgi:hypothetical protein
MAATWDEMRDQLAGRFPRIDPLIDDAKSARRAIKALCRDFGSKASAPACILLGGSS